MKENGWRREEGVQTIFASNKPIDDERNIRIGCRAHVDDANIGRRALDQIFRFKRKIIVLLGRLIAKIKIDFQLLCTVDKVGLKQKRF